MEIHKAYRFQLRPNGWQARRTLSFAGSCRFVYNRSLAMQRSRLDQGARVNGYAALCREITAWRADPETAWLRDTPCHALQQSVKDLYRSYANFFAGRAKPPRFKREGRRESFRIPNADEFKLDQSNSRIFLPKLGWMRYRNSRVVDGALRNLTVSRKCGRWYVSIQVEAEIEPAPLEGEPVGLDAGIVRFATLSDGTVYEPINSFRRQEQHLRKAQQSLSRKVKFSNHWTRQKLRVQKIHAKTADCRRDYLHKC